MSHSTPDDEATNCHIARINKYSEQQFDGLFRCEWCAQKGRTLHTARSVKCGSVMMVESPLLVVEKPEQSRAFQLVQSLCVEYAHSFTLPTFVYWCALQSLTKEQHECCPVEGFSPISAAVQEQLLVLCHDENLEASEAAEILSENVVPSVDPILLDALASVWVRNAFEHSEHPRALSLYYLSSLMSHSCAPNASWHRQGSKHVLHARCDLEPGDEICISYLSDADLYESTSVRKIRLKHSKNFWCSCERCCNGQDKCRGFVCHRCGFGPVFARNPETEPANDTDMLPSEHLIGSSCASCGYTNTEEDAEFFADKEETLQSAIEELSILSADDSDAQIEHLRALETFVEKSFIQHALASKTWDVLASRYAMTGLLEDQQRMLKRKCDFYAVAYVGLNAAHAWALEAYADALSDVRAPPRKRAASSSGQGSTRSDVFEKAREAYEQARDILITLVGQEHRFVQDLEAKYFELFAG
eukprot:TRINITY_DN40320_c0_g1_i1.p1 TRINITY_DN40320_c0_g1~~TRINITY_DN40320_c0_g1_i1.p1  ORF type:complete len:474 (-),score=52.95 TRINITY_DN40320_c0_g1_i1:578-1999(-)